MKQIPERDWKIVRKIKDQLIEKFCNGVFEKLVPLIETRKEGSHKAYLSMWKLLNKEDDELSSMFDDLKRSTATLKIAAWKNTGLISDEEISQFSEETQNIVNLLNGN